MAQFTRTDKRRDSHGCQIAVDSTGLLITKQSARGHEDIFIPAKYIEQFVADIDDTVNRFAVLRGER